MPKPKVTGSILLKHDVVRSDELKNILVTTPLSRLKTETVSIIYDLI